MTAKHWTMLAAAGFLLGTAAGVGAYANVYKWVRDKSVGSEQVLTAAQATRVVNLGEPAALAAARLVLAEDLYMVLAAYHPNRHVQDAETTPESVLPEAVAGQDEIELADDDYRFLLRIKFRATGGRTRITAQASPLYRIHDADAEDAANSGAARSSSVTVNAGAGATVAVAAAFAAPLDGAPLDYGCETQPAAADRAALLVRSFMYSLDRRVAAGRPGVRPAAEAAGVTTGDTSAASPESGGGASAGIDPAGRPAAEAVH